MMSLDKSQQTIASVTELMGRAYQEFEKPEKQTRSAPVDIAGYVYNLPPFCSSAKTLVAVACHFNPQRSHARLRCLRQFLEWFDKTGIPLYLIEGSYGGQHQVTGRPRTWRVDLGPESVVFAKENLLNIAIDRLPDHYDRVLWIDTDVVFLEHDYADHITTALDSHTVVQAFSELRYLGSENQPVTPWRPSLGYRNSQQDDRQTAEPSAGYPGLAWAAHRQLLSDAGGLYDRCITGGGDVAWASAIFGDADTPYAKRWSDELVRDVTEYVDRVSPLVQSVGHVPTRGYHLYHGQLRNRQYISRNAVLGENSFDPQRHLEYAPNGTLGWSSEAPAALRQTVADYMHGRKEDE